MTNETTRRTDPFMLFLVIACLALAALVVALTIQNRSLKAQIAEGGHGGAAPPQFKAGDVVTPFDVVEDSGAAHSIKFGEGETRTVLLVFSSHCPACKQTVPVWNDILTKPAGAGVRVIGIQTDRLDGTPPQPGVVAASYGFPVFGYKRPNPDPLAKVPFIPAAIVIDPKGTVTDAWFGIPEQKTTDALKRALLG